ncbi:hypothetical protein IMY05_C4453000100 [Salix suchowensis]|nr:hypothetical protein IMY05_C4453000100 [Salix suchowensis]
MGSERGEVYVFLGLGDEWSMLVNMWLSLEKKLEFGTVTGMRNRLYTKTAGDIDDIDEFSNSAMEWWRQMQPLWRQGDANQRSQEWHSVVADANKSFASIVKSYVPPPPPSAKARGKRPQVITDEGCNKRAKPSRIASRLREDVRDHQVDNKETWILKLNGLSAPKGRQGLREAERS